MKFEDLALHSRGGVNSPAGPWSLEHKVVL